MSPTSSESSVTSKRYHFGVSSIEVMVTKFWPTLHPSVNTSSTENLVRRPELARRRGFWSFLARSPLVPFVLFAGISCIFTVVYFASWLSKQILRCPAWANTASQRLSRQRKGSVQKDAGSASAEKGTWLCCTGPHLPLRCPRHRPHTLASTWRRSSESSKAL